MIITRKLIKLRRLFLATKLDFFESESFSFILYHQPLVTDDIKAQQQRARDSESRKGGSI